MEIQVVTTKKKISKSLISQMHPANLQTLQCGYVLGYVLNVFGKQEKTFIIEWNSDFYRIDSRWREIPGRNKVCHPSGQIIKFQSEKEQNIWWEAYSKVKRIQTHIYI